jgi:all-trans-retinol dehydrogenase (NAD+)
MRVRGKRALVTGAGGGLGRAIAHALTAAGATVIVTDVDGKRATEVAKELSTTGFALDITSPEQIADVRKRVLPIDLLINNAGIVFGGAFAEVPLAKHSATVAINLTGLLNVTHAFLGDLVARPEAHIVNIASASAFVPLPWAASYAATKAAVVSFSESLREELRVQERRHVGVTAVCPSYIATGLFAGAKPARLTWMLTPESVARAVVKAIEKNRKLVILPWTARLLYAATGMLPTPLYRQLCAVLGVSTSMTGWHGRGEDDVCSFKHTDTPPP